MRRLSFLLLPLLAAFVRADVRDVEASVTVSLTLWQSGEDASKTGRNGTLVRHAPLETFRLGNRDVLEALRADGVIQTDTIAGWRIIARWAHWPDADPYAGNSYRFFVRHIKSLDTVAIPSAYLSLKPVLPAVGHRLRFNGETILSGTEKFAVLEEFRFAIGGSSGVLSGLVTGGGRYVRTDYSASAYFIPDACNASLQGFCEESESAAFSVVRGNLSFDAAKFAPFYTVGPFPTNTLDGLTFGSTTSAGSVTGSSAGVFASMYSDTSLSGWTASGSYNPFTFSQASKLTFSPLPESTANLSYILTFSKAGTLTLGTGETLAMNAGDTLALNTLTLDQLSPLSWVPASTSN